jgi:hypothetical protein
MQGDRLAGRMSSDARFGIVRTSGQGSVGSHTRRSDSLWERSVDRFDFLHHLRSPSMIHGEGIADAFAANPPGVGKKPTLGRV